MVPTSSAAGALTDVKRNGGPVPTTTQTIKGVEYAFFEATAGSYEATYAVDDTRTGDLQRRRHGRRRRHRDDHVGHRRAVRLAGRLRHDPPRSLGSSESSSALATSHSIELTGLAPTTTYHYRVTPADGGQSNSTTSPEPPAGSFTTPPPAFTDTTVADFGAGATGADAYVAETANGEVTLKSAVGAEFSGRPARRLLGWSATPWSAGGGATVSGGRLIVDEARFGTDQTYGSGRSLEFVATFGGGVNQHAGFGVDYNDQPFWAMFSIKNDGSFNARTNNGSAPIDTPLPSSQYVGSSHRLPHRVGRRPGRVLRRRNAGADGHVSFGANLRCARRQRLQLSAPSLSVDWMHLCPTPPRAPSFRASSTPARRPTGAR